jgi:hypothetical protein
MLSIIDEIEAAITPFPNEERTPPVIKMNRPCIERAYLPFPNFGKIDLAIFKQGILSISNN